MNTSNDHYLARYWIPQENSKIRCVLCPRECVIGDGKRGFCFVRKNVEGRLILTTYGRSSGFCIDPIEKKPLNHFYPGSSVLSFGTAGCNLGCQFCQNWSLSRSREFDRLSEKASPFQIAKSAKMHGCKSVAFTYNDPVIFAEYAMDIAEECRKIGIKTVAVTAGYISGQSRGDFFGSMDAANVDLKSFSDSFYRKFVAGELTPVLDTLFFIKEKTGVWLEITTLLIPRANDSDRELNEMTRWIARQLGPDVPLHFTAFHPDHKMLEHHPTSIKDLQRARDIGLANGLRYVYVGNLYDDRGSATFCHQCGQRLIEREGYTIKKYVLRNSNQCPNCSAVCAGHFDKEPGQWGTKRVPIKIAG